MRGVRFDAAGYAARDEIAAALSVKTTAGPWITPPRLPVPDLAITCQDYLRVAGPLLAADALARTRAAVADFLDGDGPRLQQALIGLDSEAPRGYLHDIWQGLYLSARDPLPVAQNVAGGFRLPSWIADLPLARKAGVIAFATALFLHDALSGRLPQDRQSGRPLCMLQYTNLAGTTRIPRARMDRLRPAAGLEHCVVAWRGAFFLLPLASGDRLRDPARLDADIRAILRWTGEVPPVGLLTGLPRDEWAALRLDIEHAGSPALEAIDDAAFILCIDAQESGEQSPAQPLFSWFGGGKNRWFDKTLQVIISDGESVGCNIEHSAIDGMTLDRLGRFARDLFDRNMMNRNANEIGDVPPARAATPLAWTLPSGIVTRLASIDNRTREPSAGLAMRSFDIAQGGLGATANALVQLALQITSRRLFGRIDNIYQPVHMRHYHAGRTEAAHPVTSSTVAACSAFLATPDKAGLRPMILRALRDVDRSVSSARRKQGVLQNGGGIDRHLFALHQMARVAGCKPAIFDDPAYALLTGPAKICTSAMPAGGLDIFAFAPVRRDGYGVAYVIGPSGITFCVTSWSRDLERFCAILADTTSRLAGIVTAAMPVQSALAG